MTKVNLRDRKKLQTRREIERITIDLFQRKGFDQTTIDEICDAAQVSPRTFFRYFGSKDDVVFSASSWVPAHLRELVLGVPSDASPAEVVENALCELARTMEGQREETLTLSDVVGSHPTLRARSLTVQSLWEEVTAQALTDREAQRRRSTPRPEHLLLARTAFAVWATSFGEWQSKRGRESVVRLMQKNFDHLRALLAR